MGKSSRKILAIILSIGILATLVAVPMTVNAVPAGETYEAYDVIEYADLLDTGNNHLTASGVTLTAQNNLFHYDATSASHSAIYKFRYVAGATVYFQMFPGAYRSNDPFAYRIKDATTYEKRYSPNSGTLTVNAITEGNEIDFEIARLLVATGDNAGKYYTYLKANGILLFEGYATTDQISGTDLDDSIQFNLNGSNSCVIKASPTVVEQEAADALYYYYDEIGYSDLLYNNSPLSDETSMGGKLFTYNATANTYSAILKLRWKAVTGTKFQISFDKKGSDNAINYMFGAQLYTAGSEGKTNDSLRLRPGLDDANAWNELAENIVDGANYDIEFARLKVKNGENAGKYYVYFKLNDVMISESYVAANVVDSEGNYTSNPGSTACHLSNEIYFTFWGASGNKLCAIPEPETYEDYDEVYYSDLLYNGSPVAAERSGSGRMYTYNKTSDSGSVILKLRWKNADPATEFQISFDRKGSENAINYMFGVQLYSASSEYPNGRVWLRPGYGPSVAFTDPIVSGQNYDIEFARLKVASGPKKGSYYMYFKMNDVLIAEDYVAANVVDSEGNYTSSPSSTACHLSNEIYITFWGGGGATITNPAYTETYCDYDDVGYSDLSVGGSPVSANKRNMSGGTTLTYNRTSDTGSVIFKYRWKVGDVAKFQMSFDEKASADRSNMEYMFGAWLSNPGDTYANGDMYLRPSYGSHVGLAAALTPGGTYDIEYGRLKVATGPNKNKYYVYIKIDDVLIDESYVAADVVDADGNYTTKPGDVQCNVKAGEIFIAYWGSNGNMIGTYGGIKGDLDNDFVVDGLDMAILRKVILQYEEVSGISADIADFNSDSIVDVKDYKAMKSAIVH